jgi:hypothetical protein
MRRTAEWMRKLISMRNTQIENYVIENYHHPWKSFNGE